MEFGLRDRCEDARGAQAQLLHRHAGGGGQQHAPQMHGEADLGAQLLGELLRLGRLRALVAGHVQRIADDCFRDGVLAQEAGDGWCGAG